jgi:hypothetical protein
MLNTLGLPVLAAGGGLLRAMASTDMVSAIVTTLTLDTVATVTPATSTNAVVMVFGTAQTAGVRVSFGLNGTAATAPANYAAGTSTTGFVFYPLAGVPYVFVAEGTDRISSVKINSHVAVPGDVACNWMSF